MPLSRQAATWRRAAARTLRARRLVVVISLGLGILVTVGPPAPAQDGSAKKPATVRHADHADTSRPLRDIRPKPFGKDHKLRPEHEPPSEPTGGAPDPAVQSSTEGASAAPDPMTSFDGLGAGFTGPQGTFAMQYAPPDTDGDGSTSQTASASLNVIPPTTADFTVSASPASRQVNGARSVSYTITVASKNGFAGTVNLAANNQAGVTAGMNPASVTLAGGGSKTSTLTASASAPGTYTITVMATSTGISKPVTVTLRRVK